MENYCHVKRNIFFGIFETGVKNNRESDQRAPCTVYWVILPSACCAWCWAGAWGGEIQSCEA